MTAGHVFCTACASTIRDKVDARGHPRHHPAALSLQPHQQGLGDVFLALVLQHPALRSARAHDGRRSGLVHREEARQNQAGPELLRPGGARRIQALLPQSGDHPRHLRGLPRRRRHRSRARRAGHESRPQDRMPGAAAVGRDRRRRAQQQAGPGRDLAELRVQYRRRTSRSPAATTSWTRRRRRRPRRYAHFLPPPRPRPPSGRAKEHCQARDCT